jgi:integrase
MKGVHRVRKRLASGQLAEYHYAWRGGPRFWDNTMEPRVGSMEYIDLYREIIASHRAGPNPKGTFQEIINEFLDSSDFASLGDRTRKDHKKNIIKKGGIAEEFGNAPIAAFEEKRIRKEVLRWRDKFSSGTGDNIMATMQRLVSFAHERGILGENYLRGVRKQVKSNRAEVIWRQDEIDLMVKRAPKYVSNILVAAIETGYRPGDLNLLDRSHFEERPNGEGRILIRTQKSRGRNFASVPVTRRMKALLDSLPEDQTRIIVGANGQPWKNSQKLGQSISEWRDKLGIRKELRLYDARGTAVTRLVRAGCTLGELASHMGWSFQHASQMLERYAALDPEMSDGILRKVMKSESALQETIESEGDQEE